MAKHTLTQENPTIPQVVRALRESMTDGSMMPASRSLVLASCKRQGIPLKDGRVLNYQQHAGTLYFAVRNMIERGGVRIGQRWASRDKRDVNRNPPYNQRREVVRVEADYAYLTSEGDAHGYPGVRIKNGAVDRHRLVEDVA